MNTVLFETPPRRTSFTMYGRTGPCAACIDFIARLWCCPTGYALPHHYVTSSTSSEQGLGEERRPVGVLHTLASPSPAPVTGSYYSPSYETYTEATTPPLQAHFTEDTGSTNEKSRLLAKQFSSEGSAQPTDLKSLLESYARSASFGDFDNSCPTCLETFTDDNPSVVAKCGHRFHLHCIYEWQQRKPTCPVCGNKMEWEEVPQS
jgi:hypothetical protein